VPGSASRCARLAARYRRIRGGSDELRGAARPRDLWHGGLARGMAAADCAESGAAQTVAAGICSAVWRRVRGRFATRRRTAGTRGAMAVKGVARRSCGEGGIAAAAAALAAQRHHSKTLYVLYHQAWRLMARERDDVTSRGSGA